MSLTEASEARKARLIALRKRKAGEAVADEYVWLFSLPSRLAQNQKYARASPWAVSPG